MRESSKQWTHEGEDERLTKGVGDAVLRCGDGPEHVCLQLRAQTRGALTSGQLLEPRPSLRSSQGCSSGGGKRGTRERERDTHPSRQGHRRRKFANKTPLEEGNHVEINLRKETGERKRRRRRRQQQPVATHWINHTYTLYL